MQRSILNFLVPFVLILSCSAHGQEIRGWVLDEKKEPMISAAVRVFQNGIQKGGSVTDFDGYYFVKPLEPGHYNILVLYAGYDSAWNEATVQKQKATEMSFELKSRLKKYLPGYQPRNCGMPAREPRPRILTKEEIYAVTAPANKERVLIKGEMIVCCFQQCWYFDPPGKKTLFYAEISTMP